MKEAVPKYPQPKKKKVTQTICTQKEKDNNHKHPHTKSQFIWNYSQPKSLVFVKETPRCIYRKVIAIIKREQKKRKNSLNPSAYFPENIVFQPAGLVSFSNSLLSLPFSRSIGLKLVTEEVPDEARCAVEGTAMIGVAAIESRM